MHSGRWYAIYPASEHLHEDRAYCCLSGIIWALARCYNGCGCASRAPGIRLIKAHGSRVYMESPSRNTSRLTTVQYLAVYVKDPPSSKYVLDPDTSWAVTDPASFVGRLRSGFLFLGWTSSFMIYSNWAARWATCLTTNYGPPGLAGSRPCR